MATTTPKHGAFYTEEGNCTFSVWAPERKTVELIILGSLKEYYPLQKDPRGYWTLTLNNIKPGSRYMYRLNEDLERPDPASFSQPEGVHKSSEIIDLNSFSWNDEGWKGIPLNEMIQYELHTGTFTNEGDFNGIISRLDYLKDLGINTIEILPVAQFPGTRNWGYDGVFPFAVQNSYGGVKGLKQFVNAAHQSGIAVVLDVVYNHLGPEGNYFNDYGPYFTEKYKTPWGKAINFDDAWCDGVREFYWQNALMWLDEFHIDGLRLDAVHAIWDAGAVHFMQTLKEKVDALEQRTGRQKVLIAEIDLNNPRYINSISKGGYGLDGQWIDEFHHALHGVLTGETDGYYSDFGKLWHLEKSFRDSYVYTGQFSEHRKKHFGMNADNPYGQFIVFAQNHDQVGNRFAGDRLSASLSFEALKLAAATILLSPHVPMLFMGEEYGEKNPFQYFVSHTDPELIDMVRKGRKEEFSYFKWEAEVPDPFSEETFTRSKLSWDYNKDEHSKKLLEYYRFLISFRKDHKVMQCQERNDVIIHPVAGEVLAFERICEFERLFIVFNFSKQDSTYQCNTDYSLHKIFDSSSETWLGKGEAAATTIKSNETITLRPESVLIYQLINLSL